jgi:hypothetical protein
MRREAKNRGESGQKMMTLCLGIALCEPRCVELRDSPPETSFKDPVTLQRRFSTQASTARDATD